MTQKPTDPEIGDKMRDGTILAGVSPDTGKPMFISPDDGIRYPAFTRFMDAHPRISGFLNEHQKTYRFLLRVAHHIPVIKNQVPSVPPIGCSFNEALKYAKELDAHGHQPAGLEPVSLKPPIAERLLNRAFNSPAVGNRQSWYWSSSRRDVPSGHAWEQRFSDGLKNFDSEKKPGAAAVRFIRHETDADQQKLQTPTTPKLWSDASYRALATWWADHLPGAKQSGLTPQEIQNIDSPAMNMVTTLNGAARQKHSVTREQYAAFVDALTEEMKHIPPRKNKDGRVAYIELGTDYDPDQYLAAALEKAGIGPGITSLPWKTGTSLFTDGQIFVPTEKGHVALAYEGRPGVPFIQLKDMDFSGCPSYRGESRYLVTDLSPGQRFETVLNMGTGPEYREQEAKAGRVLVIPEYGTAGVFETLTSKDAFNLRSKPTITFAYDEYKERFADGHVESSGATMQKIDDQGHFRSLSPVFRAKQATETFATGTGYEYTIVQPGDYVTETLSGDGDRKFEVIPKSWLDEGARRWLPSAPDGTLIERKMSERPSQPSLKS